MDHEWGSGPALLRLLHLLWLLPHSWTAPQGWQDNLQNHTFQQTMYCQSWSPSVGLSEAYDDDQLFSFDFSQNTRVPRLPEFADWANKSGDNSTIFFDKGLCQAMIHEIGPQLEGKIPESRVPNNALPSDLLENVLCGVAFGLGVLGIIVGLVLIIYFRKPCSD
ncbi:HLA class II histocompatibility antigen, DM alpha chain isoform 3-T3 [Glossophaga mutica]